MTASLKPPARPLCQGQHQTHNHALQGPTETPRGEVRRCIVALLREHPEGLTPAEMRSLLGVDKDLGDTCLGMRRDGLGQRVGPGRYVVAPP
jgi:hypothetical protein